MNKLLNCVVVGSTILDFYTLIFPPLLVAAVNGAWSMVSAS
jgi:hypothetical protein